MSPKIQNLLAEYSAKLHLQRYAPASIKTYNNALMKFLVAFQQKKFRAAIGTAHCSFSFETPETTTTQSSLSTANIGEYYQVLPFVF